jgi:hypothetical protein
VTAAWAFVLLHRSSGFVPWLAPLVLVVGLAAALALAFVTLLPARVVAAVAAVAVLTSMAGPAAYALQTASQPHTGSIPTAGPAVAGARGGPGGARAAFGPGGPTGAAPQGLTGTPPQLGTLGGGAGGGLGGGLGGLLSASSVSTAMQELLAADASSYTWVAAAIGSNNASGYQLATGLPVMAIGGFNGSDPSPTPAQFQADVAAGKVHYFIGGSGFGGMQNGGSSSSSDIATWVAQTFPAQTVDGVTVYDLTATSTSGSASTT